MADKLIEGEGASRPGYGVALTGDESFSPYAIQRATVLSSGNALRASGASLGPYGCQRLRSSECWRRRDEERLFRFLHACGASNKEQGLFGGACVEVGDQA